MSLALRSAAKDFLCKRKKNTHVTCSTLVVAIWVVRTTLTSVHASWFGYLTLNIIHGSHDVL